MLHKIKIINNYKIFNNVKIYFISQLLYDEFSNFIELIYLI